jgi:hypothetical protein
LYLSIHYKTKNKIFKWAVENQCESLWTKYYPWYWIIPWFAGGVTNQLAEQPGPDSSGNVGGK